MTRQGIVHLDPFNSGVDGRTIHVEDTIENTLKYGRVFLAAAKDDRKHQENISYGFVCQHIH